MLDVGTVETIVPLAVPHAPMAEVSIVASQKAAEAPPDPEHVQLYRLWHSSVPMQSVASLAQSVLVQTPIGVTEDAVPVLQSAALDVGAVDTVVPLADPQTPCAPVSMATHLAVVPPPDPVHDHSKAVGNSDIEVVGCLDSEMATERTSVAVPLKHKLVVGAALSKAPSDDPHAPSISFDVSLSSALHITLSPEPAPMQIHIHGPLPYMEEAVPALQRFVVGAVVTEVPLAEPQEPVTSVAVEQAAEVLPHAPFSVQVHVQGPLPLMLDAVPVVQSSLMGTVIDSVALAEPHCATIQFATSALAIQGVAQTATSAITGSKNFDI